MVESGWETGRTLDRRGRGTKAFAEYFATWRHTSVAGDMMVSRKERFLRTQGGTADSLYGIFVLDGVFLFRQGLFCVLFLDGILERRSLYENFSRFGEGARSRRHPKV